MITVGLVKEIFFIAKVLGKPIQVTISRKRAEMAPLEIQVTPDANMVVFYRATQIWSEKVDGAESFFGVESCDTISRIIACIDNNDISWREKYDQKKPVDGDTKCEYLRLLE
jgi:hypothetical protein